MVSKQSTIRLLGLLFTLLLVSTGTAFAETLLYTNEIYEMNPNKVILDADDTGGDVTLQFGTTLNESLLWNNTSGTFVFSDDLNITGNLDVDGTITAGTSDTVITQADGQIDGEVIAADTIDDDSIDFGMGADQVGADDITMTDEFDNSNNTNVQDVMDDIDAAIGDKAYTEDNYVTDGESSTDSIDALDQQVKDNADAVAGTANITGTTSNTFTLDNDNTGGNILLQFGQTLAEQIYWDSAGTAFTFTDDVQINGNLGITGTITGATIDGDDNTLQDIPWTAIDTRTKKLKLDISDLTVIEDGSNNQANIFTESETGTDPHEYYYVRTGQTSQQDLDLKFKVLLPEDFVDFTTASNDLSFYYKNTGAGTADSKIDILVEDDDGDDAFTAADGQDLFNLAWTEYTDEFDGGSFNPAAGEYIYVTVKGYARRQGGSRYIPYIGEIVFTYTGK